MCFIYIYIYTHVYVGIYGAGFIAINITFENTAGPAANQAIALLSVVDSIFYRCKFVGYQDTLLAHEGVQFYRECEIYGTIDFIFGFAAAVIQNSFIYVRRPLLGQYDTITAQGRKDKNNTGGIVIHNCTITKAENLHQNQKLTKVFLGRPWKNFSRTVIMQSFIDDVIDPKGWLEWHASLDTIYYAEYDNRGPGAITTNRVKWGGYHIINRTEAEKFTVRNFISGEKWISSMGIPCFLDLI